MNDEIIFDILDEYQELFDLGQTGDYRSLEQDNQQWFENNPQASEDEIRRHILESMAQRSKVAAKVEQAIEHFQEEDAAGYNEYSLCYTNAPLSEEMIATMHEVTGIWRNLTATLVRDNLDLVKKVASRRHQATGIDDDMSFDDLLGVGSEALLSAAKKMQTNPKTDFRKFALQVLTEKVKSHQKQNHPVPFKTRKKLERIKELRDEHNIQGYDEEDKAQLADALGVSNHEIKDLLDVEAVWGVGYDIKLGDNIEELEIPDLSPSALDLLIDHETQMRMSSAMTDLTKSQRQVILNIYFHHHSFRETAKELGVSLSAVKKHHKNAMEKLRSRLEDEV